MGQSHLTLWNYELTIAGIEKYELVAHFRINLIVLRQRYFGNLQCGIFAYIELF